MESQEKVDAADHWRQPSDFERYLLMPFDDWGVASCPKSFVTCSILTNCFRLCAGISPGQLW